MPTKLTGWRRSSYSQRQDGKHKRKRENVDIEDLQQAVTKLDPTATYASFADLPLSAPTTAGLQSAHFSALTDIQAQAIPRALQGDDILGAAKTGSGKTLAFLVPVLENLYRAQLIGADAGLGAMIISPTRELAIQIFEVLRNVGGKGHVFAAGLVIGGKSLREEQDALSRMNIVVCTPGRILQHLSQTATFNVDNLRMLVLDEADRIMDMGFQKDVDAVIEYLPADRQTLLFSATQTKRVSDLSRLALQNPQYISVHEAAAIATPHGLQQNYVLTPLADKLDILWSFIQSSKKSKILVFLSSGKQVRFVYESFRHMQPGIPLLHLHGRQKQTARLDITQRFSRAKHSCLFATDVVARGLDFPAVDWVIQADCPEDADTYIHRVGRTARYERAGRAVLFLDPSEEEGMLTRLEQKKVPIERINIRAKKQQSVRSQLQHICLKDSTLKYLGQKAFTSYVRSLHVQKDKDVFQLDRYSLEEYAASLGLPGTPRIKFLKADAEEVKRKKNAPRMSMEEKELLEESGDGSENRGTTKGKVRTKYDRMFERQNQDILAHHYTKMLRGDDESERSNGDDDEGTDGFLGIKRRIAADEFSDPDSEHASQDAALHEQGDSRGVRIAGIQDALLINSKRKENLLKSKKKLLKLKDKGSKVLFDDQGNARTINVLDDEADFRARGTAEDQRQKFLEAEGRRVRLADEDDKTLAKEKRKAKKERKREREKEEMQGEVEEDAGDDEDIMANFISDANDIEEGIDSRRNGGRGKEKRVKWFENVRQPVSDDVGTEIETLDDLEAEATKLLW